MKKYDVTCPVCGHINRNLYLEETDGWMECDKCRAATKSMNFTKAVRIPVFSMKDLKEQALLHA